MAFVYPRKMFYDGALQHGISIAVAQQKAVLCFVTDGNEESLKWENEWLTDEAIFQLIKSKAVALRLEAGSDEAGYLAQIFPLPKTPTVVIMKNGDLKEYIITGIAKDEFMRRVRKGLSASQQAPASQASPAPAQPSGQQLGSAQAASTAAGATATSETVRRILAERSARLQAEKEEADRRAAEEYAKAEEEARAKARASDEAEQKKRAQTKDEYRKRQKQAKEARERVLKRIEDDRKERRMRAEAREAERLENQGIGDVAASLVKSPETKLPSFTKPGEMTSIQVRLFDGSTIRTRLQTSSALKDVRKWVDGNRLDGKEPFTFKHLRNPLPSRPIDETEEDKTLGDLELAPSSTLVLVPVDKYASAYTGGSGNIFVDFYRYLVGLFVWFCGLVGLRGSRQAREASPAPAAEQAAPSSTSQDRSRIRGFQNPDDRRGDQQLYNGNSLNFEPRPDEDEK